MISNAMSAKLSEQVTHEFNASQTYLAMACWFDSLALKGLTGFFRRQADEERGHALKIVDYLLEVGAKVAIGPLAAPRDAYATPTEAIEAALEHEKKVTRQIHDLVALAISEKDYATQTFLNWFVDEQVEEVSSMEHMLQIARLAGPDLLKLDMYVRQMPD